MNLPDYEDCGADRRTDRRMSALWEGLAKLYERMYQRATLRSLALARKIERIAEAFKEVDCTTYCASMGSGDAECNCGVEALRRAIESEAA